MDAKVLESAMSIIMNAGDARLLCKESLNAVAEQDFGRADQKMKEAQKKITIAHRFQTDAIQDETRGEKTDYTLIFAHAQDTLMTVYSEINLAKQMIRIFARWEQRLAELEQRCK